MRTDNLLNLRAIINLEDADKEIISYKSNFPLKNLNLLFSNQFKIKIKLYDDTHNPVFENIYTTNDFGELNIKIALDGIKSPETISRVQLYELSHKKGIEILLGSYLLYNSESFKKLLITDFDKTLADTSSANPKDIWGSLTSPITSFPTIENSLKLVRSYMAEGFIPFVVSSSPHFYESSIRDWLYQHEIYNSHILLKDYRQMISLREDRLKIKDVLAHGFYKLDHLFRIIFMTGLPDEIVLMGDNYEADHLIYVIFAKIINEKPDPWHIWNSIKNNKYFKLSTKQNSIFLENLYKVSSMLSDSNKTINIQIYIRKVKEETNWEHLPEDIRKFKHKLKFMDLKTSLEQIK